MPCGYSAAGDARGASVGVPREGRPSGLASLHDRVGLNEQDGGGGSEKRYEWILQFAV